MQFSPSPLEQHFFRDDTFYIKRDDILNNDFSGNKARKFHYFLTHNFSSIKRIISYGSNQSNAMYSLSVLAKRKHWEFIYFCDHIPNFLRQNPIGNYAYALQNGMKIIETKSRYLDSLQYRRKDSLFIEEGGRQSESEWGIKRLAEELTEDIAKTGIKDPYLFLPSGTGTTALFLQKYLTIPVFTCSCVGDDDYLQKQWKMLSPDLKNAPLILKSSKKYHYGKLYSESYAIWNELQETMGVTFDLMYDPVGWNVLMEHIKTLQGTPIYLHQGGLLGNISMEERYKRKANML
ncbi:MAG: 1-aminocyclopropane-1-carboxylate deaminase/D-cysteine desulfhydrase [Sulfurospirillaceae bacterium]|nr:1-aminocyclopropane-1-carboxylate deaminase/D-cysteine desulfhydrase [Sulfurospirillaceae bacterium]MDD2825917.1 1-aminocyclopropane-1-carboxylate deaminase/D-cysteine desulfhydrase [Sulfurospirillaceae bacterium]